MSTVKLDIGDAIIWGVKQITIANGYNNTIIGVYDPPLEVSAMPEFPSANYFEGEDFCENTTSNTHQQTGGNQCKLFNSFIFELDIWARESNNPRQMRNYLLADVQKYFGLHWSVPDSTGQPKAFNCMYHSSASIGIVATVPRIGVTARFKVWYDQKLTDPSLRG